MLEIVRALAGLALALLTTILVFRSPRIAIAADWESERHGCKLSILGAPAAWEWLPAHPDWGKAHIIRGARRKLGTLKNGKPGDGRGGLLHLAYRDAPKGMTLEQAAVDKDIRAFLLARFAGTAYGVESETITITSMDMGEHPAAVVRAEGEANNLIGKKGKASGVLVITVAKGKLYLLRMYGFPSEFDEEMIGFDLSAMEAECLQLLSTKEAPPPRPAPSEQGQPQPAEDAGEDEVLERRSQRWRLTRPSKIKQQALTEEDRAQDMALRFGDSDAVGAYAIYLYVIPNSRVVGGKRMSAPDLGSWMSMHWWNNFTATHPKGDIFTWKWPRKTSTGSFLTLPRMEDAGARRDVITGKQKRPVVIRASEALRKMKFVEKPKQKKLGRGGKVTEAMRGCLEGRRLGIPGQETVFRFAWRDREHSYRLLVTVYGQAYVKWGSSIRALLESLECNVKFRDP